MKRASIVLFLWLTLAGCAAPRAGQTTLVAVEGRVTVRGSEPFTALVLETPDAYLYVLTFDGEGRTTLQAAAPATLLVTGTVYADTWDGRSFAHLRVQDWEAVPGSGGD